MGIKQFNGSYIPIEDRVKFRFNSEEDNEYPLWLTRRVTLFILAATEHLVEKRLEQKHNKPAAKAIAKFNHDTIKERANFDEEYIPASQFPLGTDPVLVMDVKCVMIQIDRQDVFSLDLILPDGADLNLKLSVPMMEVMRLLLERLAVQGNWGHLPLNVPEQNSPAQNEMTPSFSKEKKNFH